MQVCIIVLFTNIHSLYLGEDDASPPHPTDGRLGHMTYLAKEMSVEVNVLLLSRSFKIHCVIRHVFFFSSALTAGSGVEL